MGLALTNGERWNVTKTRKIEQAEQGQYIEVPFYIPEGVESINVKMMVKSENLQETIIDLGVRDPYRVRGWSGGARTEFFMNETSATPGYLHGTLHQGTWAILLGSYKVDVNGCEVQLEMEFISKSYQWLSGDLHLHSVHSDGTYTLEQSIEIARSLSLDFIALTDHNTVSQNYARPRDAELTIIPGMELTTNKGHLNLLGIDDPLLDFRVNSDEELAKRLEEARKKGAMITLNHPYCRYTGWHWDWNFDYDFVEVWNGPWREDNKKALDWWHDQLVNGKKIIAIGGSDTHRPDPYVKHGSPTTWVYSQSRTQEDIFKAMQKGNVIITYIPTAPFIEMSCGEHIVGETVVDAKEAIKLTINNLRTDDIIKVISNQGVEWEEKMADQNQYETSFYNDSRQFYRVEVWRYVSEVDEWLLASLSNPIYFD